MRRTAHAIFLALALASTAGAVLAAAGLTVGVNQSRRLMLRGPAANVIVSDPSIADVAVLDGHSLLVMGRGYGSTDLLVLDRGGHTLYDGQVTVAPPELNRVTVHRGNLAFEYACSPRCQALATNPPEPQTSTQTTVGSNGQSTTTTSTGPTPTTVTSAPSSTPTPSPSPGI